MSNLNKLNLSDRETIAICIVKKYPLAKIGEMLNRSTSSISREIKTINTILKTGIKKGRPLSHLFAVYENELIISERTAYRLINDGVFAVQTFLEI